MTAHRIQEEDWRSGPERLHQIPTYPRGVKKPHPSTTILHSDHFAKQRLLREAEMKAKADKMAKQVSVIHHVHHAHLEMYSARFCLWRMPTSMRSGMHMTSTKVWRTFRGVQDLQHLCFTNCDKMFKILSLAIKILFFRSADRVICKFLLINVGKRNRIQRNACDSCH